MNARRNTRTGGVLERMVLPALEHGGYEYRIQVDIGQRLGIGHHFVDVIAASSLNDQGVMFNGASERSGAVGLVADDKCIFTTETWGVRKLDLQMESFATRSWHLNGGLTRIG